MTGVVASRGNHSFAEHAEIEAQHPILQRGVQPHDIGHTSSRRSSAAVRSRFSMSSTPNAAAQTPPTNGRDQKCIALLRSFCSRLLGALC